MTRPFEGIRVIDCTHVLAGPFAAYQLAVLGADVIKIEPKEFPDQSRSMGPPRDLRDAKMGTHFLTQNANKRSVTLNLKAAIGCDLLKRLVVGADVFIENYRAGAFPALGLGYEDLKTINPKLVYASMTGYGQSGPRGPHTVYDHLIQASSGLMASTGTWESGPLKTGSTVVDYATGAMSAFAISSALFQRQHTGFGQHIDLSMHDVTHMLMGAQVTGYFQTGKSPSRVGNQHTYPTSQYYAAKEGHVMLGCNNTRQMRRLWETFGYPEFIVENAEACEANRDAETAVLTEVLKERTADEWESFFQARHIPCERLRSLDEALTDEQVKTRRLLHEFKNVPGLERPVTVPMAAFSFAHGGPSLETPPPRVGEHTDEVLRELGLSDEMIAELRTDGII